MKILFSQLSSLNVERVIFCSLEQALFQVYVQIDGQEHVVWDSEKRCLRSRNLIELRERLAPLGVADVFLRHESPYDEMIGLPESPTSNRMEVPLAPLPFGARDTSAPLH